MTTVTNKQLVKAFKAAKEYLWDGTPLPVRNGRGVPPGSEVVYRELHDYICHALETASSMKDITCDERDAAKRIISSAIAPWYSVESWLTRAAKVPVEHVYDGRGKAIQTYRHEWLDHLIKEFSE